MYEPPESSDGYRVLIDRIWPRGVSKEKAHLDAWEKEIAPSKALREWYEHDPAKWAEFQERYEKELEAPGARAVLDDLARRAEHETVTLVYASKAADISNAAVLERLLGERVKAGKVGKGPRS
ncbi:MAG TPA: DUF488 family protein [Longimicrobiaceae bacterium]|nr:DUF488 family protein [Longimicrobiaceae bacterium]